jgi:hypothetical protein
MKGTNHIFANLLISRSSWLNAHRKVASSQVDLNYCVSGIWSSLLFFWHYFDSIHQNIVKSRRGIKVSAGWVLRNFHDRKMRCVPTEVYQLRPSDQIRFPPRIFHCISKSFYSDIFTLKKEWKIWRYALLATWFCEKLFQKLANTVHFLRARFMSAAAEVYQRLRGSSISRRFRHQIVGC